MSRPRSSAEPIPRHLIYGEGPSEEAFLCFLKATFVRRGSRFEIRTASDEGGDPVHVLRRCLRARGSVEFTSRIILMDTDRPWHPDEVIALAAEENIRLLPSSPCLEGLLLEILEQRPPADSGECKRLIHAMIPEAKMMDPRDYTPLFPRDLLMERAFEIPTLDALIRFLETGKTPETILP
jgi:hypothetical protein